MNFCTEYNSQTKKGTITINIDLEDINKDNFERNFELDVYAAKENLLRNIKKSGESWTEQDQKQFEDRVKTNKKEYEESLKEITEEEFKQIHNDTHEMNRLPQLPSWQEVQSMDRKDINNLVYTRLTELCELSNGSLTIESLEDRLSREIGMEKSYFLFIKFMFYLAEDLTNSYIGHIHTEWYEEIVLAHIFINLKREYDKYRH